MKMPKVIYTVMALGALLLASACDDQDSYADLLTAQDHYVNNFLADQRVILEIPEDTVFICATDFLKEEEVYDELSPDRLEEILKQVPYYRLDDDCTMYMQVIYPGTKGNKVAYNEQIYFRYIRWALSGYSDGRLPTGSGNMITLSPAWFRFGNYSIQSSYNWGMGIQAPLQYLPVDCVVNIVIKSENGLTQEIANVLPYLYRLSYGRRI